MSSDLSGSRILASSGWRMRLAPLFAVVLVLASCRDSQEPLSPRVAAGNLATAAMDVPLGSMTPVGAARLESGALRLSGPAAGAGAAWLPQKRDLVAGFTATFQYVITPGQNTKDGLAFVIQAESPTALGGGQLGFNGLEKSLAVAFDTRTSAQVVTVQPHGEHNLVSSLGQTLYPVSGGPHLVKVVYAPGVGGTGTLKVYFGSAEVLRVDDFDISDFLGAQTEGWVGFTAHTEGGQPNNQTHDVGSFNLDVATPGYPVTITVSGSPGIVGITVVATRVRAPDALTDPEDLGRYWVGTTEAGGVYRFPGLPAGHYIFSAYRFKLSDDPQTALNQLVVWPWPEGAGLSGGTLAPSLAAYSPTIAIRGENGGIQSWETRTPSSLARALQRPFEVGPGGTSTIAMTMAIGNIVRCTFLDDQGNPIDFTGKAGKVYAVVPLAGEQAESLLPPIWIPPGFSGRSEAEVRNLKRGFGVGFTDLTNGCELHGVPPGRITVETDPIRFGDQFLSFYATGEVGSDGGTTNVVAAGTPLFIKEVADHTFEPIGDATGPRDFGNQIRYGWIPRPNSIDALNTHAPSDTFIVTTQFRGQGQYVLDLWRGVSDGGGPAVTVIALCEAKGCRLHSTTAPRGVTALVSGVIDRDGAQGFLAWRVILPSSFVNHEASHPNNKVTFRIWSGASRSNPSDWMQNGALTAQKRRGNLGSWVLGSVM